MSLFPEQQIILIDMAKRSGRGGLWLAFLAKAW